jgi:hypothetical protein
LHFTALHAKPYLISFCILLLLGALVVSALAFAHPFRTHAAAAPVVANSYGTAHGCPSNSVGRKSLVPAVTVTPQQANSTIVAHTGNLIEFQFPFGRRWNGPTTSPANLTLLQPAGYADRAAQVCVWHFVALGGGVAHLDFSGGPLCKAGQPCPYFAMLYPFTINVVAPLA